MDLGHDEVVRDAEGRYVERIEMFIKDRSRGRGYVADFVFKSRELPVDVYGILATRGHGLEIVEMELWNKTWPDDADDGEDADDADGSDVGIEGLDDDLSDAEFGDSGWSGPSVSGELLRRIPVGRILGMAQFKLAQLEWRDEGIIKFAPWAPTFLGPEEMESGDVERLTRANEVARGLGRRRGRPPLSDEHLRDFAQAAIDSGAEGPGLTRRLADQFGRPEATITDWIGKARQRGFLGPTRPGRRGASPGPRLGQ